MIILEDIVNNICKYLVIYDFRKQTKYRLVNIIFNELIKKITNFYETIDYEITMATQIRHWRPELDCPEVLDQNFIIFDNFHSFKYWKNNTKDFHSCMQGLESNIIQCELFTEYFCDSDFTYFVTENEYEFLTVDERKNDIFDLKFKTDNLNFIINPEDLRKESIKKNFDLIKLHISKNDKLEIFFIYIFELTNFEGVVPLGFSFLITPYFDENITKMQNFLEYSVIKKNCLAKHNIAKYAYNNPELPEDWEEYIIN